MAAEKAGQRGSAASGWKMRVLGNASTARAGAAQASRESAKNIRFFTTAC